MAIENGIEGRIGAEGIVTKLYPLEDFKAAVGFIGEQYQPETLEWDFGDGASSEIYQKTKALLLEANNWEQRGFSFVRSSVILDLENLNGLEEAVSNGVFEPGLL